MTDKQYKLARTAAYVAKLGEDADHKDLDKFLDAAALAVANPGAYKQQAEVDGKGKFAEQDISRLAGLLQKYGRETGNITPPKPRVAVVNLGWFRCPCDFKPSVLTDDHYVFMALKSSEYAYNNPREKPEVPPAKFCIPVTPEFTTATGQPAYDARKLYKDGDAVAVKPDGEPVKYIKLTAHYFAKHGLEFTSDGEQVKPTTETLKTFLRGITTARQRKSGVVIQTDGNPFTVIAELVRVGLAEPDGEKTVKITPETFRNLGLTDSAETPSTSEAAALDA